jgi:NADH-quinone oxidoreductase subunit J
MTELIFYIFSGLTVFSGLMVITLRNPVHAVLFLIFAFFNAAGLFIMLGAEFIAMILIIVYVGAVAVLFLFVVMMLNINTAELKREIRKNLPVSAAIAVSIFFLIFISIAHSGDLIPIANHYNNDSDGKSTNTEALGMVLYTDYFFVFQASGIILLIAMIGAIVLTLTHSKDARRQSIFKQILRSRENSVELVDIKTGKGVKV